MVTWTRDDGGPAMDEVVAVVPLALFRDGFESGDARSWSVVP